MPSKEVLYSCFQVSWKATLSRWSPSLVAFLAEESGLNVGNQNVCVKHAVKASEIQ